GPRHTGGADGERLIAKARCGRRPRRTTTPGDLLTDPEAQRSFRVTTRSPQLPTSANGAARRRPRGSFLAGLLLRSSAAFLAADNSSAPAAAGKVNINQASVTQIALLPRIGEKVAGRV